MGRPFLVWIIFIACCPCIRADVNDVNTPAFGDAAVARITDCCDTAPLAFKCDIRNFPPIVGRDIEIIINGIAPLPADANSPDQQEIRKFIRDRLTNSKRIMLRNMRRGQGFYIIADVNCDRADLAKLLIEKGYARPGENPSKITTAAAQNENKQAGFIASKKSKIFHRPGCRWTDGIAEENLERYDSRQQAIEQGKRPCKTCKP